jgi:hypothetical protein
MKHEVNSWVQASSSSHCDQTNPHNDVSKPTNSNPLPDSPTTSHSASTQNPFSRPQLSTVAASQVRDEETLPKIITIKEVESAENPSWHRTWTLKAFPLPVSDSVHTLDCDAREDHLSPYLTRRCPVCISASGANLTLSRYVIQVVQAPAYKKDHSARAIVCLDTNFSQRRRHSVYKDPELPHLDTYWISPDAVEKMAVEVEATRTGTKQQPEDDTSTSAEVREIPDEVLDDCQKMFVAAQNISKANNKVFADTAVMALVCRHNCPLLLVNMTSAGECQHYALALLRELFHQLPNNWDISLLYDIACQLRCSMQKVCIISSRVVNFIALTGISLGI